MIKHFNSAIGAASGSAASSKGKGGNALIWIIGLGAAIFISYKFIEARNRAVVQQNN
jgi:hypothetical protein